MRPPESANALPERAQTLLALTRRVLLLLLRGGARVDHRAEASGGALCVCVRLAEHEAIAVEDVSRGRLGLIELLL